MTTMLFVRLSCVLSLFVLSIAAKSQSAVTSPLTDSSTRPREKIHLHTDKDIYLAGETIWFKAYILSDGLPALATSNLYVNLLNAEGSVLEKKIFPLADATGDGSFVLPDSLDASNLLLAAYTINSSDSNLVYYKNISVVTKRAPQINTAPTAVLQFLSEGGTFVIGVPNHLAFKSDLSNGFPFEVKGAVKNNAGIVVDSFAASHNGMGEILFTPETGEKYYAEWLDEKNNPQRTFLPAATNGIAIHAEQVKDFFYYVIQNPSPDDNLREINITVSQDDEKIYMATIDMSATPVFSGKIATNKFEPGVARITVSGKDKLPLAERICFMQNDFRFNASINLTKTGTGKRAKNTVEIDVPDTLSSNLSLSIFDAQFSRSGAADIFSDLLLTNDIKGYVHEPGWYFADASAGRKKALDLVMLTNGWRKYNRQQPKIQDSYITLSGLVADLKKNPRAEQSVTLMVTNKDSSKQFYNVVTDPFGRFTKSGLIFYDTATVFYQFNRKSADPDMQLVMDRTGVGVVSFKPASIPPTPYPFANAASIITALPQVFVPRNAADGFTDKGYKLDDVSVKGRKWRNNPMLITDEKYTTGIFRSNATAYSFDVMNDPFKTAKGDVMNYLLGKVPGLTLEYGRSGGQKSLVYGSGSTRKLLELIFINEQPFQFDPSDQSAYSEIQALNMDDIAYVKFFNRHPLQPDKPALAIYLKKGIDEKNTNGLPKLKVAGYSTVKEFYSPDYSIAENQKVVLDKRTTLYWQPYLFTDRNNHKITVTFYNNDISTNLYLVLEGMNEAGKMVRVEKALK